MRKVFFGFLVCSVLSVFADSNKKAIRIRKLPLSAFSDAESRQLLIRYLLSNPDWDVRDDRGKIRAYRRLSGSLVNTAQDGYYTDTTNAVESRLLISFSGVCKDHEVEYYTDVENKEQKISIPTSRNKRSSKAFQSYIIIKESAVTVEVFEASNTKSRKRTAQVLEDLNRELLALIDRLGEIKERGHLTSTPSFDFDSIRVQLIENGTYMITASYNFNRSGFIFVRMTRGDETLSGKVNRSNSRRPVGWSAQGEHRFHISTFAVNTETLSNRTVQATVEIIFVDETGREERILKREGVELTAFSRK